MLRSGMFAGPAAKKPLPWEDLLNVRPGGIVRIPQGMTPQQVLLAAQQQMAQANLLSQAPQQNPYLQLQQMQVAAQLQNALVTPPVPFAESWRCKDWTATAERLATRIAFWRAALGPVAGLVVSGWVSQLDALCGKLEDGLQTA